MARKNGRQRSPEEAARREKIRELLALSGVEGMEDIQQRSCQVFFAHFSKSTRNGNQDTLGTKSPKRGPDRAATAERSP